MTRLEMIIRLAVLLALWVMAATLVWMTIEVVLNR